MELIAGAVIVVLAAAIHACTGFGFSLLATPFLLLVFPPAQAIQINIALSILISVLLLPKLLADIDRTLLRRLVLGSCVGAPPGILVYLHADPDQLRLGVGVLLLLFTALVLSRVRFDRRPARDVTTGGLSGALTAGLGLPGPPLMVYFAGTAMAPAALRSTTLACFLFTYSLALVLQIAVAGASREMLNAVLVLIPATGLGVVLGQAAFRRIDATSFMRLLYGLLVVTGLYLVIDALRAIGPAAGSGVASL